ncbi:Centrosomal spindle body, CEP44-domain-containing protein [Phlyctochytrium arcticum]|nr:Centrosomal spindle body, CEP44-domain-containing protein [Phlyctochytrium arcticum]
MASTGDLKNNLQKVQSDLRAIRYNGPFDQYGASKGDPKTFLPLLHFILLDYSHVLAAHFATQRYDLYGKKDTRFLESVYRLLRDEFGYKPQLTRDQFLAMGFAERKLLFVGDVIRLAQTLHANLCRKNGTKVSSHPHHGVGEFVASRVASRESSAVGKSTGVAESFLAGAANGRGQDASDKKSWGRNSTRAISPKHQGRTSTSPFRNPTDSFHHQYNPDGLRYHSSPDDTHSTHHMPSRAFRESQVATRVSPTDSTTHDDDTHHFTNQTNPTRIERHYVHQKYTSSSPPPPFNRFHPANREGNTIYEPAAPPPRPAAPPAPAETRDGGDMSYMSQPSVIVGQGMDETFMADDEPPPPPSNPALQSHTSGPPSQEVGAHSDQRQERLPQQQQQQQSEPQQHQTQPYQAPSDQPTRESAPPLPYTSRSWVAPTAPPASSPLPTFLPTPTTNPLHRPITRDPLNADTHRRVISDQGLNSTQDMLRSMNNVSGLDVNILFENFMRLFVAKEEELAALRTRHLTLESRVEGLVLALEQRLNSVEGQLDQLSGRFQSWEQSGSREPPRSNPPPHLQPPSQVEPRSSTSSKQSRMHPKLYPAGTRQVSTTEILASYAMPASSSQMGPGGGTEGLAARVSTSTPSQADTANEKNTFGVRTPPQPVSVGDGLFEL